MRLAQPEVTLLFGHAKDSEPLTQPPNRLGQLVKLFREAGIAIEEYWLSAPLDEFDRLLRKTAGFALPASLAWPDAVRRYARPYNGLHLLRAGFRLRIEGEPARP